MPITPDRILFEDEHLLAVTKLSGELVVRGKGRLDKLPLLDFLQKDEPGLKPIHRLDFETSGVIVFAKNSSVLAAVLDSRFAGWKKVYVALVLHEMKQREGVISIKLPARSGRGDVDAQTKYNVMEKFKGCTLVEATIERGQFHQIRRHLASIKHPLVLDDEYGEEKFNRLFQRQFYHRRFFLHASQVELPHPVTGKMITVTSPMPKVFGEVIEELRKRMQSK